MMAFLTTVRFDETRLCKIEDRIMTSIQRKSDECAGGCDAEARTDDTTGREAPQLIII